MAGAGGAAIATVGIAAFLLVIPSETPQRSKPATASTTQRGGDLPGWPRGVEAYTVFLASKRSRDLAQAAALRIKDEEKSSGVLRSDDHASLVPGYWVAYTGRFESEDEARAEASAIKELGFPDAYPQRVSQASETDSVGTEQDPEALATARISEQFSIDVDAALTTSRGSRDSPGWTVVTGFTEDGDPWAAWVRNGEVEGATPSVEDGDAPSDAPCDVAHPFTDWDC